MVKGVYPTLCNSLYVLAILFFAGFAVISISPDSEEPGIDLASKLRGFILFGSLALITVYSYLQKNKTT